MLYWHTDWIQIALSVTFTLINILKEENIKWNWWRKNDMCCQNYVIYIHSSKIHIRHRDLISPVAWCVISMSHQCRFTIDLEHLAPVAYCVWNELRIWFCHPMTQIVLRNSFCNNIDMEENITPVAYCVMHNTSMAFYKHKLTWIM